MSTLKVTEELRAAITADLPVVALESTLIAHGLPYPVNVETAHAAEAVIHAEGAVPATIGIWEGVPTVGLTHRQIDELAQRDDVLKASRRDIASAMLRGQTAATTVAATMALAHRAGIRVFATGGIGGVHPDVGDSFDISADLPALARTPMIVVCAGAKSILDLRKTLELLETLGVPVVGYRTDEFPAFYTRTSGLPVSIRVEEPAEVAELFDHHTHFGEGGIILAQPVDESVALAEDELNEALIHANREADARAIRGPARTPFLLARLAELTDGRTLKVNRELIVANARLGAEVAKALGAEFDPM